MYFSIRDIFCNFFFYLVSLLLCVRFLRAATKIIESVGVHFQVTFLLFCYYVVTY